MTNIILCGGSGTRLWPISRTLMADWITRKFYLDHQSETTFLYADIASRGQVGQSNYPWEKLDELEKFEVLS